MDGLAPCRPQVEKADVIIPYSGAHTASNRRSYGKNAGDTLTVVPIKQDIVKARRLRDLKEGGSCLQTYSLGSNFLRRLSRVPSTVNKVPSILVEKAYARLQKRSWKLV